MKGINRIIILLLLISTGIISACKLDNYEGPNATLAGSFIDEETNELVEQDIIRGTMIKLTEHGYDPVSPQYLRAKPDGTYMDKLLFANTYTVQPERGNFIPVEAQEIRIEGETKLDFLVTPYIRIKEVTLVKNGTKVTATFKLQQNVENNIKKIGLYAHPDPTVGEPMRLVATEISLDAVVNPTQEFTLEIDLAANSSSLKPGNSYFFRIGALIDVGEAKLNYAPAVRLEI